MEKTILTSWESFYVIVGSSGAALTGLQFVVIALIADSETKGGSKEIAAFGTPTVVHFCTVLLVSAILSAPWGTLAGPAVVLGATGIAGLVYAAIVTMRTRRQTAYKPELEDWIWHVVLPFVAHGGLLLAAVLLPYRARVALFIVAGVSLLFLFIGIHNAWDTVTYIAVQLKPQPRQDGTPS
jgi:hypothetical protein